MTHYADQNADERTAENDQHFQDRHDRDAARADERHSSFADSIFEFAKAQNDVYRTAYDTGFKAGYAAALVKAVTK